MKSKEDIEFLRQCTAVLGVLSSAEWKSWVDGLEADRAKRRQKQDNISRTSLSVVRLTQVLREIREHQIIISDPVLKNREK